VTGSYNSVQYLLVWIFESKARVAHLKINLKAKVLLTIHLFEVRDLVEIAHIDDGKVLDPIGDTLKRKVSEIPEKGGGRGAYDRGLHPVAYSQDPSRGRSE
jgi:hypothetical protein